MKKISEIIKNINYKLISGSVENFISGLEIDSREIKPGYGFIAVKGETVDGHQFIDKAIAAGAKCIFSETIPLQIKPEITYIIFDSVANEMVKIIERFYDFPSEKLKIIGVTGTNGKTTIASLLYNLFNQVGIKSGLISTVAYYIGDKVFKATHTTPNSLKLNQLFAEMVNSNCEYCFMEVSSHAIDQKRIAGINFTGGIFTNLTHDHLDYHKTFKHYLDTKKKFFDSLSPDAFALSNIDDRNGIIMLQNTKAKRYTFSCKTSADFKGKAIETHIDSTCIQLDGVEVWTNFTGNFNISNLTAVYAASILCGLQKQKILEIISSLKPVQGRFETIKINNITGIVDYAHTPDALENILNTINEIKTINQTLITVVGAGGDRDKTKRPIMAKIAVEKSDRLILTSDNPRTESPESILDDMEKGIESTYQKKMLRIADRKVAIKTACSLAKQGDIILIAGKGHENYQEINGIRYDFDDKKIFIEQMNILFK